MPRELSNEPSEMTFDDRISGDKITLEYDVPNTEDRIRYTNGYITRKANQVVSTLGELRMKAGSKIFRGFKTGAFNVPGKGLISSHQGDPNFEPNWKGLVKQYAPDFIEMLAVQVFEAPMTRVAKTGENVLEIFPPGEDEWADAPDPTPKTAEGEWIDASVAKAALKSEDKETNPL